MAWFSKSYTLGLIFILAVALIWAGASVLIQHIYQDMDMKSPFFLTYMANSLLVIYLPLWQLWICCGLVKTDAKTGAMSSTDGETNPADTKIIVNRLHDDAFSDVVSIDESFIENDLNPVVAPTKSYTHWDVLKIAAIICPFWFLSNCLYNYSLFLTSVSSSTIISNMAGAFTLAFSYYAGLEGITYGKVLGIIACFLGAVCVGLNDTGDGNGQMQTVTGDIVAFFGAVGYGLYTTIIRYKIPDDEGISMQLLLGYIGLLNAVVLAPVLPILYVLNLDDLTNLTYIVVGFIILNGLCNSVLSDYLWARAVVLTSPTVATIGVAITIPLAMVSDLLIHGTMPTILSGFGAFLVVLGFVLVNITADMELEIRHYIGLPNGYQRLSREPKTSVDHT
eukprot:gene12804-14785_t